MCPRRVYALAFVLIALLPSGSAFSKPVLRHTTGIYGVGIQGGVTSLGKSLAADFHYHFSPYWLLKVELGAEVDKFPKSSFRRFSTQPVVACTLYTNHKNLFINALGGTNLSLASPLRQNDKLKKT